jgi:hypothetical protein
MVTKEGDVIVGLEDLSRLRREGYGRADLPPLVPLESSISRPMQRAALGTL